MKLISFFNIGRRRWRTHILLAGVTVIGCYLAHLYAPYADLTYDLTYGCGYVAVILIAYSLLIGPYKLLSQKKNPVNINLRRDVGIWAGITGCIHVVAAIAMSTRGNILYLFLRPKPEGPGYNLLLSPTGVSNNIGLAATVILVALLIISNNYFLIKFKGKRWKFLQRFNYGLAIFAFIHTVLYQRLDNRSRTFVTFTFIFAVALLGIQLAGFFLYRSRRTKIHSRLQ
jgi:sulfoxide reductase heme-binding subunit YedZ